MWETKAWPWTIFTEGHEHSRTPKWRDVCKPMSERYLHVHERYKNFIDDNSSDQGKSFRATRILLKQNVDAPYPQHDDTKELANEMGAFFV